MTTATPSFHCVFLITAKVIAALALIGVSLAVAAFAVLVALALLIAMLG